MNKNFINFHILISHSPSCLNRDDMNMQKSAIFGGQRRVRISSQSLKRAMRQSDYYQKNLGDPSLRTKHLGEYHEWIVERLADRFDAGLVTKALLWLSGKKEIETDSKGDAVAPWAVEEVAYICQQIQSPEHADLDEKKSRNSLRYF
ncbi:type I-E CRISPR-associated protein Cas7/Cse4/CasC, partial [Endozoicomonas sp. ONNA2]|uniref:type I-E CRISPR-associated protein Cas7/Cse4/CasC n=1 Tax=Endozoicomonas sp. ONNA2 TaxID=2828741 RepID=UPI00214904B8